MKASHMEKNFKSISTFFDIPTLIEFFYGDSYQLVKDFPDFPL